MSSYNDDIFWFIWPCVTLSENACLVEHTPTTVFGTCGTHFVAIPVYCASLDLMTARVPQVLHGFWVLHDMKAGCVRYQ